MGPVVLARLPSGPLAAARRPAGPTATVLLARAVGHLARAPAPSPAIPRPPRSRACVRVRASHGEHEEDPNNVTGRDQGADEAPQVRGDWRAFRAGLVASEQAAVMTDAGTPDEIHLTYDESPQSTSRWAHLISQPEAGCLLVCRQPDMGFFDRTVILLLAHENAEGSFGLILNKQSTLMVKEVGLEGHSREAFATNPLYLGGPVELRMLDVLHGVPGVSGAEEISPGVFHGGLRDAAEMVAGGAADPSQFQLVCGYSGWAAYQLSGELHSKSWYVISASRDIILECARVRGEDEWDVRSNIWEDILRLAGIDPHSIGNDHRM